MKILNLSDKYGAPVVIALGFFDCIHRGHRLLVQTAMQYAAAHNTNVEKVESALLTFCNDPSELLCGVRQMYSFEERAEALKNLGLDNLIYTQFNEAFASIEPIDFLQKLVSSLNIKAIVVGEDYTFGKRALGNVTLLKEFCDKRNIEVIVKPFEIDCGRKISTSSLKNLVLSGDITALNMLLSERYFMLGEVEHARRVGTKIGFPTANIRISDGKLPLAAGVYATVLSVDGKQYASMTNVGAKPTFDIQNTSIEAYILDFDGDLYGKTVKLSFVYRMRSIQKFASVGELQAQLTHDEQQVRSTVIIKEI